MPPFKSYEEEANFWDTHSVTGFWDPKTVEWDGKVLTAVVDPKRVKKEVSMTIRLQRDWQRKLESVAFRMGLSVSTLARKLILDGLRSELTPLGS